MNHREAQPPTGLEDPRGLPDRTVHVVDVLQRHERDHEVEALIGERDPSGVGPAHGYRRLYARPPPRPSRSTRPNQPSDDRAQRGRATNALRRNRDRASGFRGSGTIGMKRSRWNSVVAVVVGRARPGDEPGRVALPLGPQIGARTPGPCDPVRFLAHRASYPVVRLSAARSARNRSSGMSGAPSSGNGNGHPGREVVGVARHDVRVQMRHLVAEQVVVQLDRAEGGLDRPPHLEQLAPERGGLVGVELGRLGDVPAPPHHDRQAPLDVRPPQVRVGHLSEEEPGAMRRLIEPRVGAHRAAGAVAHLVERRGPLHPSSLAP